MVMLGSACSTSTVRHGKAEIATSEIISPQEAKKAEAIRKTRAAVQSAEDLYTKAVNEQLTFYAPDHFKQALRRVERLRKLYKEYDPNDTSFFSGPDEEDLIEQADKVTQVLNQAFSIKKMIVGYLGKVLDDKSYLEPRIVPELRDEYNDIVKDIADLMADIEDDESVEGYDDERLKLEQALHHFEVKLMKAKLIKRPEQALHELDRPQIPKSYEAAEAVFVALAHQIELQPRDTVTIDKALKRANKAIGRASSILEEVQWIKGVSRRDIESVVLKYHTDLGYLAHHVEEDFSERPFSEQVIAIKDALLDKQKRLVAENTARVRSELLTAFEEEKDKAIALAVNMKEAEFEDRLNRNTLSFAEQIGQLKAEIESLQRALAEAQRSQIPAPGVEGASKNEANETMEKAPDMPAETDSQADGEAASSSEGNENIEQMTSHSDEVGGQDKKVAPPRSDEVLETTSSPVSAP